MPEHEASRTLVKSPPELWAECSDAASLARHLGGFGEIRITRLEPETAVAWEGEHVRGTVRLEPSGWGTKVTLSAEPPAHAAVPARGHAPAGEPQRPGWIVRLLGRLVPFSRPETAPAVPQAQPQAEPQSSSAEVLAGVLDSLGQAHRRPFSRN